MAIHDVIVYRAGAAPEPLEIELPALSDRAFAERFNEAVRGFVGAPWEHVNVFYDFGGNGQFRYRDMFVNENGRLVGMQRNSLATVIYRNNVLTHEPSRYPSPDVLPWIAGPAVLFREKVWR